ncbi:hypothetical protein ACFL2T_00890 [Elusimicrobiota bacterium]
MEREGFLRIGLFFISMCCFPASLGVDPPLVGVLFGIGSVAGFLIVYSVDNDDDLGSIAQVGAIFAGLFLLVRLASVMGWG